jgi:uncharacterized damage-inducible protein DinB
MNAPKNQNKVLELFKLGPEILENALANLSNEELDYLPAKGGWTIREIVHHLADGDDLWKMYVKIALGNEQAEFSLQWYTAFPQTEWAKKWNYEKRSIEESLTLLKASRFHVLQLMEHSPDAWNKSAQFRDKNGEIEEVPIGFVIQMQADHIVHHVKRINEIHEEFLAKQ